MPGLKTTVQRIHRGGMPRCVREGPARWFATECAVAELVGPNPTGIAGIGPGSVIEAGLCERFPEFPTSAISNSIGYLGSYLTR